MKSFMEYHLTSRKRGIYVGCTDMNNLGDEAVYENIKALFQQDVYLYKISYKYRDLSLFFLRKFWKTPDLILLGGGTLISRGPKEGYLKLLTQVRNVFSSANVYVFGTGVSEVQLAAKANIPTDVVAWSAVLNACRAIAVRGHISKKYLHDWKITAPLSIAGDPAILSARDVIVKKKRQKKIGINFCNILDRIHGLDGAAVIAFGTELLDILIREGWDIYLLPMTDTDLKFMHDTMLKGRLDKVNSFLLAPDINTLLDNLTMLDVFIGQRLHSIVFAHAVYTPFYAIEYHSKTKDYLDFMGLHDHSMRTDELNATLAYEKILNKYNSMEQEQQVLFEEMQKKKKLLIMEAESFLSKIK